jgi:hypothetical protein
MEKLSTREFLGSEGFLVKELLKDSHVAERLILFPGIHPRDYVSNDIRIASKGINEARRIKNYADYLVGKNPCVHKVWFDHESNIPKRTYEGYYAKIGNCL